MAIEIIERLRIAPDPAKLPCEVTCFQTLRSRRPSGEKAAFAYSLSAQNDVWFESGGGPTKVVERRGFVGFGATTIKHSFSLVRGGGRPVMLALVSEHLQGEAGDSKTMQYRLTVV